jgi:endoglycosylceramidase
MPWTKWGRKLLPLPMLGGLLLGACQPHEVELCTAPGCADIDRSCALDPPPMASDRLRADGTALRDALGRRVLLRGVNASGRAKMPPFAPFEYEPGLYPLALASYLDRAQSWGIDVIRAPFTWEAVEPGRGTDDEAFLARYDALIDAAWARRIWTVVDFHQDVYTRAFCGDGFPIWTLPPTDPDGKPWPAPHDDCPGWFQQYFSDTSAPSYAFDRFWHSEGTVRQDFRALWTRMATRYANRPGVIAFEVINEPMSGSADLAQWEKDTLSPFYDEMTTLLHANAPETLVALDTSPLDALAFSANLAKPASGGVLFAPHWYDPGVYTSGGFDLAAPATAVAAWKAFGDAWNVPTWIGETGYPHDHKNAAAGAAALYDALDAQGVHVAWWEYSVGKTAWNAEALSLVDADGHEYTDIVDAVARPYPRAVAGDDAKWGWNAAQKVFTLAYQAKATGLTEIALPPRAFPKGWQVTVTGDACASPVYDRRGLLVRSASAGAVKVVVTAK